MPDRIILNKNDEIYKYFKDLKLYLNKPQEKHLASMVTGIIGCSDKRTISNITKTITSEGNRSSSTRFLTQSPWDDEYMNNKRKMFAENRLRHVAETSNEPMFAILDDTINKKNNSSKHIEALGYNYSHTTSKQEWSHCILGFHVVASNLSLPYDHEFYLKKEYCQKQDIQFKSKVDIAIKFLKEFKLAKSFNTYFLTDSWYTSPKLINEAFMHGYHTIGALKSNRIFYPADYKIQLKDFIQHIEENDLDLVTVKGTKYFVYRYEGKVNNLENAVILISWEKEFDKNKSPMYLISTDVTLDNETIIRYYSKRWEIETSFRYLKDRLGFDHYQMRSLKGIRRFLRIQYLAYNYLELYRQQDFSRSNLGELIDHLKESNFKKIIEFIYDCSTLKIDKATIYQSLKLTA
jgi:hypothetical protein